MQFSRNSVEWVTANNFAYTGHNVFPTTTLQISPINPPNKRELHSSSGPVSTVVVTPATKVHAVAFEPWRSPNNPKQWPAPTTNLFLGPLECPRWKWMDQWSGSVGYNPIQYAPFIGRWNNPLILTMILTSNRTSKHDMSGPSEMLRIQGLTATFPDVAMPWLWGII